LEARQERHFFCVFFVPVGRISGFLGRFLFKMAFDPLNPKVSDSRVKAAPVGTERTIMQPRASWYSERIAAFLINVSCVGIVSALDPPVPDGMPKSRYISFTPGNPGQMTALRVTLARVGNSADNGKVRWVGPPGDYNDCPARPFKAAFLQCAPHYQDWGPVGLLDVTGGNVAGDGIYAVQAIAGGDDIENEANYSAPAIILTGRYTDTVGIWNGATWTPPDGLITFHDFVAGLDTFACMPTSLERPRSKTRRIEPNIGVGFDSVDNHPPGFIGIYLTGYGYGSTAPNCADTPRFLCGNNIIEPGETCEDGNTASGDGCDANCRTELICGNSIREPGEECDDGNTDDGDGCSSSCLGEVRNAILSFVPVSATASHTIVGNEIVIHDPDDEDRRVVLEIRVRNWDPKHDGLPPLKAIQVSTDPAGFTSGAAGSLQPPPPVECETQDECTSAFGLGSRCTGNLGINYCEAAFQDETRDNYVFPLGNIHVTDQRAPRFRYGSMHFFQTYTADDGTNFYAGTMVLDYSPHAGGTFTMSFEAGYNRTFLVSGFENTPIPIAAFEPATIRVLRGESRYLSFAPSKVSLAGGDPVGLRVKLVDSPLFPGSEGQVRWAAPPQDYSEGSGGGVLTASALQCDPNVQDWSGVNVLSVFGREVVPQSTYEIRSATAECIAMGTEACMSAPIMLRTERMGDAVWPVAVSAQPNFADIAAHVSKFQAQPDAVSLSRTDISPEVPNQVTNFADISAAAASFSGLPYPFAGPGTCP